MLLRNEKIILKRYESGSYVDGYYTQGALSEQFMLYANIQPAGAEIRNLAEGDRTTDAIIIYTDFQIKDYDIIIRSNNIQYKVVKIEDWNNFSKIPNLAHYKSFAVKIEKQNNEY